MRMTGMVFILLYLCCSCAAWAEKKVSLRDKIGQMLIVGFNGTRISENSNIVKQIREANIGGVILYDYNEKTKQYNKNIENPAQLKQLNLDLQQYTQRANINKNRDLLPLLISIDYEGGKINRLKPSYGFLAIPSAAETGMLPLKKAKKIAHEMAITLQEQGFNLNFAPVLDMNVNPRNPVIAKNERSFSNNPHQVSSYAKVYTQQFLNHHIQCAYKHFPGHGSSNTDSHKGFVDVTQTWKPYELLPYQILLNKPNHCGMVMSAHTVNRQLDQSSLPATLSHKMLTGLLRKQLSFDGVIVTDDIQMKAISDNYSLENALLLSINAGADMIIFANQVPDKPQDATEIIDMIEAKVASDQIHAERIEDAYRRIVTFKRSISKE